MKGKKIGKVDARNLLLMQYQIYSHLHCCRRGKVDACHPYINIYVYIYRERERDTHTHTHRERETERDKERERAPALLPP